MPPDSPYFADHDTLYEGWKYYEISNHLGNVMATINDRKAQFDTDADDEAEYYEAAILSATDYYPFGFDMPGRKYQVGDYRYGFNGKEQDTDGEWGQLTHYDYGFRIYNPGIGRFLSVDPLTMEYPWYTPYQFAGNKPIWAIDLDGLEEYLITYFYDNEALTGLTVKLTLPNAIFVIKRIRQNTAIGPTLIDDNRKYYPPSKDKFYEDAFLNLLRNNGVLSRINSTGRPSQDLRINVPFSILPNSQTRLPGQISPIPMRLLDIPPPDLNLVAPIPVGNASLQEKVIDDIDLNVVYESWIDIPSNVSTVIVEIESLVDRLKKDPSISITVEANVGGGIFSSDPEELAKERAEYGKTARELAESRMNKMVKEFKNRAEKKGVNEDRIKGKIGSKKEKSVRVLIHK